MSELYERIKTLCDNRGVNITEMCKQSGASRGSLTDLNKGRIQTLSAETLSRIGSYLGVSVDELLGKQQDEDSELLEYLDILRTRPECRILMSTLKNATKEEVEANVRVIEALRGVNAKNTD